MIDEKDGEKRGDKRGDDDFWDLGKRREKKYAKPDFTGHTIGTTEIIEAADKIKAYAHEVLGEMISEYTEAAEAEKKTVSPSFWRDPIGGGRIATGSYRRHVTKRSAEVRTAPAIGRNAGEIVAVYENGGALIRRIEVRTWHTETEFYGRFSSDAALSHRSPSPYPAGVSIAQIPYFSYVPQYAHMNGAQINYYRYVRENIRAGMTVECDLAYLQLYIYEIINLPDEIPPSEGAHLLAGIWLGYRKEYPRLDGYLCEWLADYCMIHGVPMPDELVPILDEVTPKAQFKEFFFDAAMGHGCAIGAAVAEAVSDYDYRTSRYYRDNHELYDEHIPAALSAAVSHAVRDGIGVFAFDREYRSLRDSYCGAIATSSVKRRIDVSFCSFTRRADARSTVTDMVKYAENKVRGIAGIKSKLSAEKLDGSLASLIDRYFEPFIPVVRRAAEDRYMPADYLKNYEAEESGFDFSRASDIERNSWANTDRLVRENFSIDGECGAETVPDVLEGPSEYVEGEITFDGVDELQSESGETEDQREKRDGDEAVKSALHAALDGKFTEYCRSIGVIEGDMAERVNTRMLDVLGDVALEYMNEKYKLIEDYREDIEEWL